MVEGGKCEDKVVDFGGGYADGEALVVVIVVVCSSRGCGRTARGRAKHARRDVAVDVDGWLTIAVGEGADAGDHGEDDGDWVGGVRDEGDVGDGDAVEDCVDCFVVIVAWW